MSSARVRIMSCLIGIVVITITATQMGVRLIIRTLMVLQNSVKDAPLHFQISKRNFGMMASARAIVVAIHM